MKCFYHLEKDAVAICKSCNRGICMECVADVPPSVACKGKCEKDVADLNLIVARSKTVCQKTGTAYQRHAIVQLMVGLLFIGIGILPVITCEDCTLAFVLVPMGCLFLLLAFFSYRSGRQISKV